MNKKFLNVNALLKVEGLEENEGKVVLTTQQLQAVEDNLAELQGKVENNGNLEKTIADKLDAFSEEVKNTEGIQAKIQKSRMFSTTFLLLCQHHQLLQINRMSMSLLTSARILSTTISRSSLQRTIFSFSSILK